MTEPTDNELQALWSDAVLPDTVTKRLAFSFARAVLTKWGTPQPTQAQAGAVPLTSEQERAIREAYESAGSESYFSARPQIDTNDRRRVFKAGFERGWDAKTGADHA